LGHANDFILNDESKFTPNYEDYKTDKNILKRQSRDTKIDQRGKKELLDLCISYSPTQVHNQPHWHH
jgi:hypothetical protein